MNEHESATEAASDPDAIRHEIEATRARIAETTEALAYKTDVPARVKEQVDARVDAAKNAAIDVAASAATAFGAAATGLAKTTQSVAGATRDLSSDVADRAAAAASVAGARVQDVDARGLLERVTSFPRKSPLGFALGLLAFGFVFGLATPGRRR